MPVSLERVLEQKRTATVHTTNMERKEMHNLQWYGFLIVLLAAICADLVIPLFLGTRYPGYHHFRDTISTLGTTGSPVQKYQCATLILVGSLWIVFAVGKAF